MDYVEHYTSRLKSKKAIGALVVAAGILIYILGGFNALFTFIGHFSKKEASSSTQISIQGDNTQIVTGNGNSTSINTTKDSLPDKAATTKPPAPTTSTTPQPKRDLDLRVAIAHIHSSQEAIVLQDVTLTNQSARNMSLNFYLGVRAFARDGLATWSFIPGNWNGKVGEKKDTKPLELQRESSVTGRLVFNLDRPVITPTWEIDINKGVSLEVADLVSGVAVPINPNIGYPPRADYLPLKTVFLAPSLSETPASSSAKPASQNSTIGNNSPLITGGTNTFTTIDNSTKATSQQHQALETVARDLSLLLAEKRRYRNPKITSLLFPEEGGVTGAYIVLREKLGGEFGIERLSPSVRTVVKDFMDRVNAYIRRADSFDLGVRMTSDEVLSRINPTNDYPPYHELCAGRARFLLLGLNEANTNVLLAQTYNVKPADDEDKRVAAEVVKDEILINTAKEVRELANKLSMEDVRTVYTAIAKELDGGAK